MQSRASNQIDINIKDEKDQELDGVVQHSSASEEGHGSSCRLTHEPKACKSSGIQKENDCNSFGALESRLWKSSELLVAEGEKNISLALDLVKVRSKLKLVQEENKQLRLALLEGINDNVNYQVQDFMNISVLELLRIRMQEFKDSKTGAQIIFPSLVGTRKLETHNSTSKLDRGEGTANDIVIESNGGKNEESDRLKVKMTKLMDTTRRERELKSKLERDVTTANQRIEALSDHIEKLMIHLKHEATSKAKSLTECSRCRKEIELLKKRNETMEKRNGRKNRAIDELKDGAKILEDQLTLMDEKYMDLRMKLDWTRVQTERVMNRKEEEIKDLRAKLLLAKQDLLALRSKKKVSIGTTRQKAYDILSPGLITTNNDVNFL